MIRILAFWIARVMQRKRHLACVAPPGYGMDQGHVYRSWPAAWHPPTRPYEIDLVRDEESDWDDTGQYT